MNWRELESVVHFVLHRMETTLKTEDNFGNIVAINNDTVIISARGGDGEGSDEEFVKLKNSGAAYVFNRDD